MKRIFILICMLLISAVPVYAKTLKMIAITQKDFIPKENEKVTLKIDGNYNYIDGRTIYSGTLIKGYIVSVTDPKIGKRDGYVYAQVTDITDHDGKHYTVNNPKAVIKLSKYKPLDIKEKSLDVGASAAGFVVKNISYPINFVRGVVTAEDGENRISSGLDKAYEKSVFSYIENGQELILKSGDKLTVTIKFQKTENEEENRE